MAEERKTCTSSGEINTARRDDYSSPKMSETLQSTEEHKLIQDSSWTKVVPYKHWHVYTKPSDSIGSIFTPSAYHLRIRALTQHAVKSRHPFGIDNGALVDPPRVLVERHNEEVKRKAAIAAAKIHDALPDNIVNLKDLADDTWLQKKSLKAKALKRKELSVQSKKGKITKRRLDQEVITTFL